MRKLTQIIGPSLIFVAGCTDTASQKRFDSSAPTRSAPNPQAAFAIAPQDQSESGSVERSGVSAELKLEELVTGNLTELNGRYKLRVAYVTYEVGGFIGNHHHAGPGLRCVLEGQLTYVQEGVSSVFGPGDCFYEPGNVDHHARNDGQVPVRLLNFQILPKDWEGSSAITVTPAPSGRERKRP